MMPCRIDGRLCDVQKSLKPTLSWQQVAMDTGAELAYVPLTGTAGKDLRLDEDVAARLLSPEAEVFTLAHMGNVLGQVNPLERLLPLAKAAGALVILDCAQSATCLPLDWLQRGVDALCFSGHKLYGPTGIGVLVVSDELLSLLPPFTYGGGMVSSVTAEGSTFVSGNLRFEAGTPDITAAIGLTPAIEFTESLGRERLHTHLSGLCRALHQGLSRLKGVRVLSSDTGTETMVSFTHERIHAHDLATILDTHNIAVRAGHHCAWPLIQRLGVEAVVRASFGCYSDFDDVDALLRALQGANSRF